MSAAPVIELDGLTVTYRTGFLGRRHVAVRQASFQVEPGEIFGYIGANGAGKTSTIKVLVSLQTPAGGTARVLGHDVRSARARQRLGFLPENPYFYEYLTAREALRFYARLSDVPRAVRRRRIDELLELVELSGAADRAVRGYSKGMRQRLGLAQALVNDPDLVILDEPMTGLDPYGRAQMRDLILALSQQGKTVFFSSHILSDVEAICSRVGLIHKGEIKAVGSLQTLLAGTAGRVDASFDGLSAPLLRDLRAAAELTHEEDGVVHLTFADDAAAQAAVQRVVAGGGRLRHYEVRRQSLEDYFLRLAGRSGGEGAS